MAKKTEAKKEAEEKEVVEPTEEKTTRNEEKSKELNPDKFMDLFKMI